jgi:iron(II)-dependent oxidoreductase
MKVNIIALMICIQLIFILKVHPTEAFQGFAGKEGKTSCQTLCHQAENIEKAHHDKTQASPCKECHEGVLPVRGESPFTPFSRLRKVSEMASNQMTEKKVKAPSKPAASSEKTMALISAGEFVMGSNERWDDESPEHIASTEAFYIDLYEVTNSDYFSFVNATKHEAPYHWPNGELPKGKEKHPVVYVNWFDARDYCEWQGKRLPNEQEWEKAARGEDGLIYPWGNEWSLDKSNNPYNYSTGTEPVGSYANGKSPYGLYDISGNVWEWVDSYYLPHPGNTVQRAEYSREKRILKGGSWFDCLSYGCGLSAPTFNRSFFTPEVRNNSFGFRCAKSQ